MRLSLAKMLALITTALVIMLILFNFPQRKEEIEVSTPITLSSPDDSVADPTIQPQVEENPVEIVSLDKPETANIVSISSDDSLPPDVDRMQEIFDPFSPHFPFIETVTYVSRVPWLTGRSAYLGDYASYYQTSKHFIARSLHGIGCYFVDNVSKGDRFNVLRKDKNLEFHLVLDLSRLKMWVFCLDVDANQRFLLKSYRVSAGHLDASRPSGSLTPTGVYLLGSGIAVYREGTMGIFKSENREMITVFGRRWIPFSKEVSGCTASMRGLGIHGVPWTRHPDTQTLSENRECIGQYNSEGCIRMLSEDIEEIFSLIPTKPSYIHIVKDFSNAQIPGKEKI